MDFVDVRFINLISTRLQKFKRVKPDLYNFRCPICGDSERSKNKARGYLYRVKNNTNYKCHNCGLSLSFNNFLKQVDSSLYKEYSLEKFKEGHTGKNFTTKEPEFNFQKPKFINNVENDDLLKIPKASTNQKAKEYLESRMIDSNKFYYVDEFKKWTNSLVHTFDDVSYDEPRIIIPLIYNNRFIGYQGRSLGKSKVKYITIMLDDESPKIYGIDNVNKKETVYVTEGPFDSTFIPNSIALCGADGDIAKWGVSNSVWIYDNEPRNAQIVARYASTISRGERIVIWPSSINQKDINDMVLSGLNVKSVIESNTYSGLEATLKFNNWKKI